MPKKQAEEAIRAKMEVPEGFSMIRNESDRTINGLRPWQIRTISSENLGLYLSYGCSLYTGEVADEVQETSDETKGSNDLPPHER